MARLVELVGPAALPRYQAAGFARSDALMAAVERGGSDLGGEVLVEKRVELGDDFADTLAELRRLRGAP